MVTRNARFDFCFCFLIERVFKNPKKGKKKMAQGEDVR